MASTARILAVVILSLAMASIWSVAFPFFLVMAGFAVVAAGKMRSNRTSCASARESAIESERANGSMASQIFLRVIACAVVAAGKKRRNREPRSNSSSSSGINHEVFLNFRGEDTRNTFTDLLHKRLKNAGIEVFKDDEKLPAGEEINQGLKDAIQRSRISIAVFSKDYASSKSCLMELVQMWECRESNGQTVIPIFYDVRPYAVKNQEGDFATSFKKHEADKKVDLATIQKWKEILRQVGGLSGFDRVNINGGRVSNLLEEVLKCVMEKLKKDDQYVTEHLVGIDLHVQEMMTKLGVVYSQGQVIKICGEDVRVIGICGMRGVGKTTLAKVVFNKVKKLFDGCSFLEVINWEGIFDPNKIREEVKRSQELLIADLQKESHTRLRSYNEGIKKIASLFTERKVLIVLDDVHEVEQIEGLAGKLTWFGLGSRIIVTTNRKNVLKVFDFGAAKDRAAEEYEVEPMRVHHALELFRKLAFLRNAPQDISEYDSLSKDIVNAIGRLPLTIVLMASNLSLKVEEIEIWRETLNLLKENKENIVKAVFEASYESLDVETKEIFLDITCFFIGKDKRIPYYMWKSCGYAPARGIECLLERYLLEIGKNNELRMPNLLRDFGRKLVKDKVPRKRCRFWDHGDATSIPKDDKHTGSVKGIGLTVEEGCPVCFTCEEFCNMSNLRYLRLDRANIQGNVENLPPSLRWLDWRECHSIPELCNMHLNELVILDLSRSPVTKDSNIWSRIMEKVEKLNVLNLQGCHLLGASLNFPAPISLEILILEDCTLLSKIGPFISKLENLSSLNLRNCRGVKQLPEEHHCMKSLTELLIDGTGIKEIQIQSDSLKKLKKLSCCDCSELEDISTIGHLRNLTTLALDGAKIDWDPETFEFPQNLQRLSLRRCDTLDELPLSIGNLGLLEVLDLSYTGIMQMPPSVKHLSNLKTLKMERTYLQNFPKDIVNLQKLEEIDFSGCRSLGGQVHCHISGLSSLRILRLSSSNVAGLPQSIFHLSHLQTLDLCKCHQLQALPKLPSSLLSLRWGSKTMTVPSWSYLTSLKELCLKEVEQPKVGLLNLNYPLRWITRLTSLETLELSLSNVISLPENFSALTQLRELTLSYMKELDLTQLPSSSLLILRLRHCKIQEPRFSSLIYLSELELDDCDLAKIDGLKDLKLLEVLKISQCSIKNLNGLKELQSLRKAKVLSSVIVDLSEFSRCTFEMDLCS